MLGTSVLAKRKMRRGDAMQTRTLWRRPGRPAALNRAARSGSPPFARNLDPRFSTSASRPVVYTSATQNALISV